MTQPSSVPSLSERDAILARFSNNLPRHITEVAAALNRQLMTACHGAGHGGIKAPFIQMLFQLSPDGGRIIDIARYCGITQQAAGQIANELERLGYLRRKPDAADRRAKKLRLTSKGKKLIAVAVEASRRIGSELGRVVGDAELAEFEESCAQLFAGLVGDDDIGSRANAQDAACSLPPCLAGLSTYSERRLMELDKAKGHAGLKLSFAQVLMYTSPHGTMISDLARINNVSKQAISQVVTQVEHLGYVERRRNPGDGRSTMIFLSDAGLRLIKDSIDNFAELEGDFVRILGRQKERRFAQTVERLFNHLPGSMLQLSGTPADMSAEAILQKALARLYLECGNGTRSRLFNRAGTKAKLSASALKIIDALEIRVPR
jgi:DNA-binding MarR family transcriptional regulator